MKYPISTRIIVTPNAETIAWHAGTMGHEFSAKVADFVNGMYIVEDMNSDFFTVSECELTEDTGE